MKAKYVCIEWGKIFAINVDVVIYFEMSQLIFFESMRVLAFLNHDYNKIMILSSELNENHWMLKTKTKI